MNCLFPLTQRGFEYGNKVLDGDINVCELTRRAVERWARDFERFDSEDPEWPYRFDPAESERWLSFLARLPHVKGKWARRRELFDPSPWQCFITMNLYGWLHAETGLRRFSSAYIEVPRKNGKALDSDTPILTTVGWKRHGDLKAGDFVFAPDGRPVKVQAVTEIYKGPCIELAFSDGEKIIAHELHEWRTERTWYTGRPRGFRDRRPLPEVETLQIMRTLRGGARQDYVHRVPVAEKLIFPSADLPIPPYTFGAWLGDGTSSRAQITCFDHEIIDRIRSEGVFCRRLRANGLYSFHDGISGSPSAVRRRLKSLGVINNKHIPDIYLRGDCDQRLELLRGLIDTDGHVTKRGQFEIVSVRERLAADILLLVRSLSIKASMRKDKARLNGRIIGDRYRISFFPKDDVPLCHVGRKAKRQCIPASVKRRSRARTITGARAVGDRSVNCIQVEGAMYLCGRGLVPTHNSFWFAGLGLGHLCIDDEPGAEVYCGATSEKQAWAVFQPARLMMMRSDQLANEFGVEVNAKSLWIMEEASKFTPIIGNPGDGDSPSCAILDELHEHKTSNMIGTMESGMDGREQPMLLQITTAGSDFGGPCREVRSDAVRILNGTDVDETVFAIIYTIDEGDDWTTIESIEKANPNLGVSCRTESVLAQLAKAKRSPSKQITYKTKRLNMWVGAKAAWMNMLELQRCQKKIRLTKKYHGRRCFIGLDLASKYDIAAMALLFPGEDDQIDAFFKFYLPEETVKESPEDRYRAWKEANKLIVTKGNVIDYSVIEDDLLEATRLYAVEAVAFDPWQAAQLSQRMMDKGLEMIEVRPTVVNFSEPMKELEKRVKARDWRYNDDIFTWMVGNVVAKVDKKDNIFPDKESVNNKIDGVVAAIMAMNRVLNDDGPSVYESRGLAG